MFFLILFAITAVLIWQLGWIGVAIAAVPLGYIAIRINTARTLTKGLVVTKISAKRKTGPDSAKWTVILQVSEESPNASEGWDPSQAKVAVGMVVKEGTGEPKIERTVLERGEVFVDAGAGFKSATFMKDTLREAKVKLVFEAPLNAVAVAIDYGPTYLGDFVQLVTADEFIGGMLDAFMETKKAKGEAVPERKKLDGVDADDDDASDDDDGDEVPTDPMEKMKHDMMSSFSNNIFEQVMAAKKAETDTFTRSEGFRLGEGINAIAVSSKGVIAVAREKGELSLWTGPEWSRTTVHQAIPVAPLKGVAFSEDGARLATSIYPDLKLETLSDPAKGTLAENSTKSLRDVHENESGRCLFAKDAIYSIGDDARIVRTSLEGKKLAEAKSGAECTALALSPDGKTLATANDEGFVETWDATTLARRSSVELEEDGADAIAWLPDGKEFLTVYGLDDKVTRWSAEGKRLGTFSDLTDGAFAVAVPRNGLIAIDNSNDIQLVRDGKTVKTLKGHEAQITALAYAPDDSFLVSADADGLVRVWKGEQLKA